MSFSLEVNNTESQNKRNREPVNLEIFKRLKLRYADNFHDSPSKLRKKLDEAFPDEITRAKDGSGSLISDKTIRNFFSANEPPTASTKILNYLCKVMLGYDSYGEAVRNLEDNQAESLRTDLVGNVGLQGIVDLSDSWVESYRARVIERLGHIKVLDMSEALSLESIYSDTYFLNSAKGKRQLDFESSFSDSFSGSILDLETSKFNKYEQEQKERISGLEKIKESPKLMILGVGGSGKTSFLKHLALRYLDPQVAFNDFGVQLISVYIHLKVWAEEIVETGIAKVIVKIFQEDIPDTVITEIQISSLVERMLKNGQFLILFDAIDESSLKIEQVIKTIKIFVNKYFKNRIVITCRLETTERKFEDFTEVEVANFTEQQVETFAKKWFEKQ
jgi:GTPase SAR1 family protein